MAGCYCCVAPNWVAYRGPFRTCQFTSVTGRSDCRIGFARILTQEDQNPLFDASPISDGHLSPVSAATSRGSLPSGSEWDAESSHGAGVSPTTSTSCRSPTGLLISRSWHPQRLLSRWWSSSTWTTLCWYSLPQPIGITFPRLCQILLPAPKPRLTTIWSGLNRTVVTTDSHLIGTINTPMWIARLAYNFTTPNSLSGWGHLDGSCPGCKPYTLRSSSNVTLTSWPQILTFFSSTPVAYTPVGLRPALFPVKILAGHTDTQTHRQTDRQGQNNTSQPPPGARW